MATSAARKTARKTPNSRPRRDQDKPAPVAINLDTMEREGRVEEPYVFVLGGRRYEMPDPQEIDYRDIIAAQRAAELADFETAMALTLPEEDRKEFFTNKVAIWKLEPLFQGYQEHYGLPAPGEADASPAS